MGNTFWFEVCSFLQKEVPREEFNMWFSSLLTYGGELSENGSSVSNFYLKAENFYKMCWVKDNYAAHISEAVKQVCEHKGWQCPGIYYEYISNDGDSFFVGNGDSDKLVSSEEEDCFPLIRVNTALTFNNFVEGESNRMAKHISVGVSRNKNDRDGELFVLCGLSGLGKTHLMHAIVNEVQKKRGGSILFMNAEGFVRSLQQHILCKDMERFKQFYRSVDFLLVDDIHFFVGKNKTQEEFFHIIRTLREMKKVMVFSCAQPPQYMQGFMEGLQTYLAQGLVTVIERPDLSTRILIMQEKAAAMGFEFTDVCAEYVAQRISRSIRDLEGALKIIYFYAQMQQEKVDIPLVREALKNIALPELTPTTVGEIQKAVAQHFDIPLVQLIGAGRSRSAVVPRQMAMFLCRQLTKRSLTEIGASFGGRNHTTVLHASKAFDLLIARDSRIKCAYTSIQRSLLRE